METTKEIKIKQAEIHRLKKLPRSYQVTQSIYYLEQDLKKLFSNQQLNLF